MPTVNAVKQCFDAWLQRAGSGKYEDQAIMENALDFAQRHFESQRFVILPAPPTTTPLTKPMNAESATTRRVSTMT